MTARERLAHAGLVALVWTAHAVLAVPLLLLHCWFWATDREYRRGRIHDE